MVRRFGHLELFRVAVAFSNFLAKSPMLRMNQIFLMGIESLTGGDYDILKDDVDYASFIIGLLAGL